MWSSVLALSLMMALNPLRLGMIILLMSWPRPVQNLLAYRVGNLTSCIPIVVVPLTLLHVTPMFRSFAHGWATSSTVRQIQFGMGVLALSIATLMIVRSQMRRRAQLPARGTARRPWYRTRLCRQQSRGCWAARRMRRRRAGRHSGGCCVAPTVRGKRIHAGRVCDRPRKHAGTRRGSIRARYHRGLGSRDRHAGRRRHHVCRRGVCSCRDHPRQLPGNASENRSGAATAARLGVGSPSAGFW
jgi:hypothetical protein